MAAGWQADPTGAHELRYFDGTSWTEHVSDAGATAVDPLPPGFVPPPPPPPAPPAPPAAPASGGGGWKDKLKAAAQQAGEQGKVLADKAKATVGEQQAKKLEQWQADPATLWCGQSQSVAGKATGVAKAMYRITADRIWTDSGVLGMKSETVPLWAVRDIDVVQGLVQRGKDVGDVTLHLEDPAYAVDPTGAFDLHGTGAGAAELGRTSGTVVLDDVEGPHAVRDLLLPIVAEARRKKLVERQTQHLHVNPGMQYAAAQSMAPPQAPQAAAPSGAPPADLATQLRELASLRDDGILSDEEFEAQKARLLGR